MAEFSRLGFACGRCGSASGCDPYYHAKTLSALIGGGIVRAKELSEPEQYLIGLLPIAPPSPTQRMLESFERVNARYEAQLRGIRWLARIGETDVEVNA